MEFIFAWIDLTDTSSIMLVWLYFLLVYIDENQDFPNTL